MHLQDRKRDLSEGVIRDIEARWKHLSLLRGLYVDHLVPRNFETSFRAGFASDLKPEARAAAAKKILAVSI